ncbi:SRPBCC family protein [Oleiharenicola lentus]|uniref:SRPBCC family protein n=1 Tax=Oleiharenicola lentus TaxID=2508720 RepID=UPI003F67B35C
MKPNDHYATFNGPAEVRLVRTLPGPIERIWEYLTDPEKRARWFADGTTEPKAGGKLNLVFQHKNISPNEEPPAQYKKMNDEGHAMACTVLRWEPPRVLSYTFDDDSDVTFELTPEGKNVILVLTHRSRGTDIPFLSGYASGWHTHFAILTALLDGTTPPPFWATHTKLKAHYEKVHGALIN